MNEQKQRQLLQRLVTDIEKRVGSKVVYEAFDKKARHFRFKTPDPASRRKKVFGFATIRPRVGCLIITTWEKCLKDADVAKMPHSKFAKGLQYGAKDGDGRLWRCCKPHPDEVYQEVVYALSIAYRYCFP